MTKEQLAMIGINPLQRFKNLNKAKQVLLNLSELLDSENVSIAFEDTLNTTDNDEVTVLINRLLILAGQSIETAEKESETIKEQLSCKQ